MTVPSFVVAGAARAGTTALTEALRGHPDVFITQPKEPHYFAFAGHSATFTGPGDNTTINRVAVTCRDSYLALYGAGRHCVAAGEGSVSTLYYHQAAIPNIQALNPAMRVVVILRDPVERAYSSYQYLRARGFEPLDDFRVALADENRRIGEGWHHLWHYTGMSRYAEPLRHFIDAFGHERVGIWFYDDLATDGQGVVGEVCRFLGVDPNATSSETAPQVNVSGQPRSRQLQSLIQTAGRQPTARRVVKGLVPFTVRERVRRANLKTSAVPDEVRNELQPVFQENLAELRKIVPSRTPSWVHG